MAEISFKIIQTGEPKVPQRSLIEMDIGEEKPLTASAQAFGPGYFSDNVAQMKQRYSRPKTYRVISFREPTTAESILIASCGFTKRAKPEIFDPSWLQAGRIFKAPQWVVINPPIDEHGDLITDDNQLKVYLNGLTKANGIYRFPNGQIQGARDLTFVPYESFKQEVQDVRQFAKSGLARGLENAEGTKAPRLEAIASKTNYPRGVEVNGFYPENAPRVVCLYSGGGLGIRGLGVCGSWGGGDGGYAFGVLNESAEGASQKKEA